MIDGLSGERLPAIDFAHDDRPEASKAQNNIRRSVRRWQHGLRLDPSCPSSKFLRQ